MKVLIITSTVDERSGWGRLSGQFIAALRGQDVEVKVCSEDHADGVVRIANGTSPLTLARNAWIVMRSARSVDVIQAMDGWPYGIYGWFASIVTHKSLYITGVGTYSVAPLYRRINGWLLHRAYASARYSLH